MAKRRSTLVPSPKVTITAGHEKYGGKTKAEATQKALDHLARFMDGESFQPIVIPTSVGHVGIVYRDTTGFWAYRIDWKEDDLPQTVRRRGCVTSSNWTRRQAEDKLRAHLAQAVYTPGGSREESRVIVCHEAALLADHVRWMDWQDDYKRLRGEGKDDPEARQALAGHSPQY